MAAQFAVCDKKARQRKLLDLPGRATCADKIEKGIHQCSGGGNLPGMPVDDFLHQSLKGKTVACGADIRKVESTPFCNDVTCPKCRAWHKQLVDAVFTPLKPFLANDKAEWMELQARLQNTLDGKT
jgi:hypothetical protein